MTPRIAETDAEIAACAPVMRELRPHVPEAELVARVRRQQRDGYRLAWIAGGAGEPVAVAGFRFGENLAWGRFLYVDDLVTSAAARSRGHGAALLRWLRELARAQGCDSFHLDSGVQRADAHRFYLREGLESTALHFAEELRGN